MINNENKDMIVRKNNSLVMARYSLTTNETRVFLLMLYRLQNIHNEKLTCSIYHEEFMEIFKSPKDYTIKNIRKLLSELRKKPIFFMEPNESKKGYTWGEFGFINGYTFNDETKEFKIEASEKIYKVVKNYMKDGYTPNNLAVLFGLRNSYAHRLYDLIRRWSGTKQVINYSIEELKELLMLETSYPEYGNFKRRVINPAIKELNSTGFIEIDIKENKIGRKVSSIDFFVTDLDKRKGFNQIIEKEIISESNNENIDSNLTDNENIDSTIDNDNNDFYIPENNIFNIASKKAFKRDFAQYDFSIKYLMEAFYESQDLAVEKDSLDENELMTINTYKWFKATLKNKIIQAEYNNAPVSKEFAENVFIDKIDEIEPYDIVNEELTKCFKL